MVLTKKAIQNSVKFLSENMFIETKVRLHPYKAQNKLRWYKIDLDALEIIVQHTKENNPKNWQ